MLNSLKIQRRQSEIRQALAGLVGKDTPSEDEIRQIETLDSEYRSNETRYRGALLAENEEREAAKGELETRSDKEFADLVSQFEVRQVALALDEGAELTGATAEVVQELRSQGGYRGIPLPLAALEQRAGETVSAGLYEPKQTRDIISRLFPQSVAARLGIQSVNITSGQVEYPVATSGAVTGWQADELSNVGGPAAFGTAESTLSPDQTLGAQMIITRKALKMTGPGLENAIKQDMSAAIATALDNAVINGTGTGGKRHLAGWVLQPIAMLLAEEASQKLGAEVMIDVMRPVQAYDVGGRARALSTIVDALTAAKEAGIDPDAMNKALTLVNWGENDGAA